MPKIDQAVDHKITGHFRLSQVEKKFISFREVNAIGCNFSSVLILKVMIKGFDGDATEAPSGETSQRNGCFGIQR